MVSAPLLLMATMVDLPQLIIKIFEEIWDKARSVDISVQLVNSVGTVTQTLFLANPNNKECFIGLMARIIAGGGHDVIRCQEMLTLSSSQRFWTMLVQVAMQHWLVQILIFW